MPSPEVQAAIQESYAFMLAKLNPESRELYHSMSENMKVLLFFMYEEGYCDGGQFATKMTSDRITKIAVSAMLDVASESIANEVAEEIRRAVGDE